MRKVKTTNLRMDLTGNIHRALKRACGKDKSKKAVATEILLQGLIDRGLYEPSKQDREIYGV